MQHLISSFETHLEKGKQLADNTHKAYVADVKQFASFLQETFDADEVSAINLQVLKSWLVSLHQEQRERTTIRRKFASVSAFFDYLVFTEQMPANLTRLLRLPKKRSQAFTVIPANDMTKIYTELHFDDNFEGVRDNLLLVLMYETGLRRNEVVSLTNKSIYSSNGTLTIEGKGSKTRILPILAPTCALLNKYFEERSKNFGTLTHDSFFVTNKGNPIYDKWVERKVKHYINSITTISKVHPHAIRHSFASHLSENGATIIEIKELLGHNSVSATQIYLHNSLNQLRKVYEKAHPKAK